MARRLVESGVRFVQVMVPIKSGTMPWDHHDNIKPGLEALCPQVDQPTAALIRDLKQRGLLDTTIVLWTGEFGRLPISQKGNGRDHNRNAFSLLLAGGGFKAGHVHGRTDDFGYAAVEGPGELPRPAGHDPAPVGPRSRPAEVSAPRPRGIAHRFAGHRRPRRRANCS